MTITPAGTAIAASTDTVETLPITLPADLADGDVGVLWAAWISTQIPTWAAGDWTLQADLRAGSSAYRAGLFTRVLTAAESGTPVTMDPGVGIADVTGGAAGVCRVYRGVDPAQLLDVPLVTADSGTAAAAVPAPAITTVTEGARLVTFYGQPTTAGTSHTGWSTPSGMGNPVLACSTDDFGNNSTIGSFDLAATAAGPYGPYSSNSPQSRPWLGATIALRPLNDDEPVLARGGWGFIPAGA